jgi:hypothetical protein
MPTILFCFLHHKEETAGDDKSILLIEKKTKMHINWE